MARHEHLPIYKKAFDLLVYFEKTIRTFSRDNKYTIGTDLRETTRSILKLIVRANSSRERMAVLQEIRIRLDELMVFVRLAKEIRAFPNLNSYQHSAGEIIDAFPSCRSRPAMAGRCSGASQTA